MCGIQLLVGIWILLGVDGDIKGEQCMYAVSSTEPHVITCLYAHQIKNITVVQMPSCTAPPAGQSLPGTSFSQPKQPSAQLRL